MSFNNLLIQTNIFINTMRKLDSIKRIDLTEKQGNSNRSNRSSLRSIHKKYSYSKSSKCSQKDNSENQGHVTDRSRQPINQFNLLLTAGQSPNRPIQNRKPKNNIKTYVRFKPICKSDLLENEPIPQKQPTFNKFKTSVQTSQEKFLNYQIIDNKTVNLSVNEESEQSYTFDKLFAPQSTQDAIYEETTKQLVDKFLNGYNATIFAYGQTGSGKTYTMLGDSLEISSINKKGIILRAIQDIFSSLSKDSLYHSRVGSCEISKTISLKSSGINAFASPQKSFPQGKSTVISCSLLEIYKQNLIDLLNGSDQPKQLKIKQNANGIQIDGLTLQQIANQQSAKKLLEKGIQQRKTRGTEVNDHSSRSHLIFTLYLKTKISETSYRLSKFNLVDLAGSQKVSKTKVNGEGLEQAKKINLSLSCLGNTINALSKRYDHVPFRDSKLTRILQESLSGNSVTRVIITCSILEQCKDETISSLKFGHRLKKIKLEQTQNICKSLTENSVNKYVYNALLTSYQQSQSKLVKIKQIVGQSKIDKKPQDDMIESLMKIIENQKPIPTQEDWSLVNLISPNLAKISHSETASLRNQEIVPILDISEGNTKKKLAEYDISSQYVGYPYEQLLKIIKEKDQKIKKLDKQVEDLKWELNEQQKTKKQHNRIKIVKTNKSRAKGADTKENNQQRGLNKLGKMGYGKQEREPGKRKLLDELRNVIEELISYRNSYEKIEKDILCRQMEQFLGFRNSQTTSHIQQIQQLIVYRKQYISKMEVLLHSQLLKINQLLQPSPPDFSQSTFESHLILKTLNSQF